MSLGDSVVEGRVALVVRRIQGAPITQEKGHHGHAAHGGGAVDGVLAPLVADARRSLVIDEDAGRFQVFL